MACFLSCTESVIDHLLIQSRYNKIFSTWIASTKSKSVFNYVIQNDSIRYQFPQFKHLEQQTTPENTRKQKFDSSFTVIKDIVSVNEELRLIDEIEKSLKRLRYQHDHWDDAIHGFRETEITSWKDPSNADLIKNLRNRVFTNESTSKPMQSVHVLDLCDDGYVKPHIDSVRFCGNIIAGLSLLSDSVMRLADENQPDTCSVYALLPRRSLYIMKDDVRYKYTHEILSNKVPSVFSINRQRRVSIVMRNEPHVDVE